MLQRQALFNLAEDIGETRDLAAQMPEMVDRLAAMLDRWSEDVAALISNQTRHPRFAPRLPFVVVE